jgi:F-type H+-transporting ATPase subunit delta
MALRRSYQSSIALRSSSVSILANDFFSEKNSILSSSKSSSILKNDRENWITNKKFQRNISYSEITRSNERSDSLTSVQKFQEQFSRFRPSMMDEPNTPSSFSIAQNKTEVSEDDAPDSKGLSTQELCLLNFRLPHKAVRENERVKMVLVPAETGDFGILPGHVPVVAKLRPGVVTVESKDSVNTKYFVSSGFAFAHADSSVDILAVEAVPVEDLDETVVRKMLSEHTAKFQSAKDDYEKATHQIGIDVSTAMVSAIENIGK